MNQVLKLLRIAKGYSITEMAKKLGVSQPYLSKIESGDKTPSRELIGKYSDILKIRVSTIEFFNEERAESNLDYQNLLLIILERICKRTEKKT